MKRRINFKTLAVFSIALIVCTLLSVCAGATSKVTVENGEITFENDHTIYSLDSKGVVTDYTFKDDGVDYIAMKSYLVYLTTEMYRVYPDSMTVDSYDEDSALLSLAFGEDVLQVEVVVYDDFVTIELFDEIPEKYKNIVLGDLKLISDYTSSDFACFDYALHYNTKMDITPSRYKSRTVIAAYAYRHLSTKGEGAKVALVGCPDSEYYTVLQFICNYVADKNDILVNTMGGSFAMNEEVVEKSVAEYAIVSKHLTDDEIRFYLDYNVTQFDFHQGGSTFIQGSMDFVDSMGDTAEGFKTQVTDRIKQIAKDEYGVDALTGLHTYAYYISTGNKALLSKPETVRQLEYFEDEHYTLAKNLGKTETKVPVFEDNSDFNFETKFFSYNMRYLRIDDEILYVNSVTGTDFYVLRGQCGTVAAEHEIGSTVYHLTGLFNMFCPQMDSQLFLDLAYYTAEAYVKGGFEMIYLDALDGLNRHSSDIWFYGGLFVKEIMANIEKFRQMEEYKDVPDPIMEYSSLHTTTWSGRTRTGAVDTIERGYKMYIANHTKSNAENTHNYTSTAGWHHLYPTENTDAPFMVHTEFTDVVDLLGKNIIAHNMGYSYNSFTASALESSPAHKKNADLLLEYMQIRDAKYFTNEVLETIKGYDDEWKLIKENGEYGFEHRSYSELKFQSLGATKKANNPFESKKPVLIRLQNLYTDASDDDTITLGDYDETKTITQNIPTTSTIDFGGSINIANYQGLAVRVYGNGKGGKINVSMYSDSSLSTTVTRIIDVDFTGWKDVFLAELDNGLFDLEFSPSASYATNRHDDPNMIKATISYVGDMSEVCIDTIKLVKATPSSITNPSVSFNGSSVTFATTITNADYIEFDGTNAVKYDVLGNPTDVEYTVSGSLVAPAGEFDVTVSGTGTHSFDRVRATIGFAGEKVFNDVSDETVASISVKSRPDKIDYVVGQTLDPTGIVIYEVMNTGRKNVVTEGFTVESVTFDKAGIYKVNVSYNGFETFFNVAVEELKVDRITVITKPKLDYYAGQTFDASSLVAMVFYNDGSHVRATSGFEFSTEPFSQVGEQTFAVYYDGKEMLFDIDVKESGLQSISISSNPIKTSYVAGELFSTAGLEVTGLYTGNIEKVITDYTYSPATPLTPDVNEIVIEKDGAKVTLPITVTAYSESETPAFVASVTSSTAVPGGNFNVKVSLDSVVSGIEAAEFKVEYDTALTYVADSTILTSPEGWEMWELESENGSVNFALVNEDGETSATSGEVYVTLTFTAPASATSADTYTIATLDVTGSDASFTLVEGEGDSCVVSVVEKLVLVEGSTYVIDEENGVVYIDHDLTTQAEFLSNFAGTPVLSTSLDTIGTGVTVSLKSGSTTLDSLKVVLRGDYNGNGKIDTNDYAFIKRVFLGTITPDAARKLAVDVNGNGYVETNDYMLVKKHFSGQINIYE